MFITDSVKKILKNYDGEPVGVKVALARILMHGKLAGTGRLVILPVDQGFEHGPVKSFGMNEAAYDPAYHYDLAVKADLSAYAAPLGWLRACADDFAWQIPTILKLNSGNSLSPKSAAPDQAYTGSVKDALELGCAAVGLTIYPGSAKSIEMLEEAREIVKEARSYGMPSVIWSYPRGEDLTKEGETAVDVCAYAAHKGALLGAHIVKVKPPTAHVATVDAKDVYKSSGVDFSLLEDRISHVVQSCFNGRRLVVFSGGSAKTNEEILAEVRAIKRGGGSGSIIGRNSFQRPLEEALELLNEICDIYRSEEKVLC